MYAQRSHRKSTSRFQQESRETLTNRDFHTFNAAINRMVRPNPALQGALAAASEVNRAGSPDVMTGACQPLASERCLIHFAFGLAKAFKPSHCLAVNYLK
ncbi:MAG: hypothetical protein IPG23_16135 [Burkholderiales bacterium]|nr:hypothetical protein [Burkholderiales bacterium]